MFFEVAAHFGFDAVFELQELQLGIHLAEDGIRFIAQFIYFEDMLFDLQFHGHVGGDEIEEEVGFVEAAQHDHGLCRDVGGQFDDFLGQVEDSGDQCFELQGIIRGDVFHDEDFPFHIGAFLDEFQEAEAFLAA